MSQTQPTALETGTEAAVKKIPVLGQVYAASEGIGNILAKAFPSVFNTSAGIQAKAAALFDEQQYNAKKDAYYFAMMFDDPNFTIPTVILNGIHPMIVFSADQYNQGVADGSFVNGMTTRPLDQGKYLLFPNIVKAYVTDQVNQAYATQQQQQSVKDTYGPFYPIVNWLKTSSIPVQLKAGVTQIGQEIKTSLDKATGTQSTWQPWAIAGLAVVGVLGITYLILED